MLHVCWPFYPLCYFINVKICYAIFSTASCNDQMLSFYTETMHFLATIRCCLFTLKQCIFLVWSKKNYMKSFYVHFFCIYNLTQILRVNILSVIWMVDIKKKYVKQDKYDGLKSLATCAPEFNPAFQWGSCYSIFSFICMFCR